MPRPRELAKNVGLLLASVLVGVGVLELYAQWFVWPEDGPNLSTYVEDLTLGKRLRPGFVGDHHGSRVSINSHGMRDREHPFAKEPGTLRILALGDSWTFGVGMTPEQTWPKRLEAHLSTPERPVVVMNTGVSGYETYHEAIYYEELKEHFEHDLVLVGIYPVNDVHDKGSRYERYQALNDISPWLLWLYRMPKHLYVTQVYENWRKARKYARRARFYEQEGADAGAGADAAAAAAANPGHFAPGEDDWTELYRDDFEGWITMRESFASLGESVRSVGVPGVALLFPDLRDLARYRDYSHPRVGPKIRAAVEDAGLVFVDLADEFTAYAGREPEVSGMAGSTHPSPAGYDLIARSVARELEARSLLYGLDR